MVNGYGLGRHTLSEGTGETFDDESTFGQRLADGVAAFGGSWIFLISFGVALLI